MVTCTSGRLVDRYGPEQKSTTDTYGLHIQTNRWWRKPGSTIPILLNSKKLGSSVHDLLTNPSLLPPWVGHPSSIFSSPFCSYFLFFIPCPLICYSFLLPPRFSCFQLFRVVFPVCTSYTAIHLSSWVASLRFRTELLQFHVYLLADCSRLLISFLLWLLLSSVPHTCFRFLSRPCTWLFATE